MISYIQRVGIAFSILFNVLLGGKSNQTVSATMHERKRQGKIHICPIIDFLSFEEDHCLTAWVKWKIIHTAINKNTKSYKNF